MDTLAGATGARSRRSSLLAMAGICFVIMLIALDSTVVGTAMPRIVSELKGFALYPWIAASYLMTNAVLIPVTGRLGDLHGRKPFVLGAIVLFTLASALCGASRTMLELVLARGLQGIGGGMLTGVAFASVSDLFPVRIERVRWQAMLSATFGISTAVGPALGGFMTEHFGWRSVFYVNLPIAFVAVFMVARHLPRFEPEHDESRRLDWLGVVLLVVFVVSVLLLTEQGPALGVASLSFVAFALAVVGGGFGFVRHQLTAKGPIIPARMFRSAPVRLLASLGFCTGFMMFVLVFYVPLLLQGGLGLSPKEAGVVVTPLLVCVTIGSITNGRLLPRLKKPERLVGWGELVLLGGYLLLVTTSAGTPRVFLMGLLGLCGLSLGFQLPNLTLQIQASVERRDLGISSAIIQTSRMLGSMVGASLAGMLVQLTFAREVQATLALRGITNPRVAELFATPQILVREQDRAALARLGQEFGFSHEELLAAARRGLELGVHHGFLLCAAIAAASFWLSRGLPPYVLRPSATSEADAVIG